MSIHPTAIIDPAARIGDGVEVGPYSIIGADVEIGADSWIGPHVVINGPTTLGRENRIFQFASIGDAPQDKKYAGEPTRLEIGDRNTIRESVTINRGTVQDAGVTRVGDDNWIMAYVHIAHDCVVGNNTILANNASLAGHVHVDDNVILGGFSLVHQFCAIGRNAFSAFGTVIGKDVPPYLMIAGHPAKPHGLNSEGLKRHGFSPETVRTLKRAYKIIYRSQLPLAEALSQLDALVTECESVAPMRDFLRDSQRGIVR
ncbi:MAG: acyl-ACP--UDP-N-acetylglucosamine O-acyltransferase [Pseudomonadota bacterium]